jgi:hypothetical protein
VAAPRLMNRLTRWTLALGIIALGRPAESAAQVGISSAVAQVALVARVAPRGSINGVSAPRETTRTGSLREATTTVHVSANTGYQLLVRGFAESTARIWVRAASGDFQELKPGSAVIVAQETHAAGQWDREVHYRIEMPDRGETPLAPLPVRYEIAISPTL